MALAQTPDHITLFAWLFQRLLTLLRGHRKTDQNRWLSAGFATPFRCVFPGFRGVRRSDERHGLAVSAQEETNGGLRKTDTDEAQFNRY